MDDPMTTLDAPMAEPPMTLDEAFTGADHARRASEIAMADQQDRLIRAQQAEATEAYYLGQVRKCDERMHQDLKRWADMVNPKLSDDRMLAVELDEYNSRKARGADYDARIKSIASGCPTPRGSLAVHVDNLVEPHNDNPDEPPADIPDVPPAYNPEDPTTAPLVPPPPPGSPPRWSAAAARVPPTPTPPGESMQPVASVAQQVPQMVDALPPLSPSRHVESMFRENARVAYSGPDRYVMAAKRVSCLLALHNELGFERLRETLCRESSEFERATTEGNGEMRLEFKALSLLLLIRVGVSSIITDNLISDNPFGPFVGPSHGR